MLSAKNISLIAGCFQQTLVVLLIRYSKTKTIDNDGGDINFGPSYLNSVAVASSEVFKLCLSLILEFLTAKNNNNNESSNNNENKKADGGQNISHLRKIFKPMMICNDKESIKLVVPALLYLIQNNLMFVALANLSVGMFQVTNQGKLLTTALLSRIILKKRLSCMQYVSIAVLGFGVAFIHLTDHYSKHANDDDGVSFATSAGQNQVLGLIAVLICCVTSSFSGVYFEFVLKESTTQLSVHTRNFHLASWSFLLAIIHILYHDFAQVSEYGIFHGFDVWVILIVVNQGMSGFVVSMMIKYADTVLKGFAMSVAAVLATLLSVPVFGASITPPFIGGALMVVAAVKMYSFYADDGKSNESSQNSKEIETGKVRSDEVGLISKGRGDEFTPQK